MKELNETDVFLYGRTNAREKKKIEKIFSKFQCKEHRKLAEYELTFDGEKIDYIITGVCCLEFNRLIKYKLSIGL